MKRAGRFALWAPFIGAAAILFAWYLVWRAGADAMRAALADFAAAQAQAGGVFTHAPMRARGFPFFLRGELGAVAYARGDWRFEADAVYLHAAPWAPGRIVISAGPAMRLAEPKGVWSIRADSARASIEAASGGWLFKAEAAGLNGVKDAASVNTGRGVINVRPDANAEGAYAVSFRLFGATVNNARGRTSLDRLDAALSLGPAARRLTIHGLDAEIGAARAQASGGLARDDQGFLAGAVAAAFTNPAALADALRVLGAVAPEDARRLETGLAILSAGAGGRIEAPLVFSDGVIKLAGVKIGKAPRIGQP